MSINKRLLGILGLLIVIALFAFNTYFLLSLNKEKAAEDPAEQVIEVAQSTEEPSEEEPVTPQPEKNLVADSSDQKLSGILYVINQKSNSISIIDLAKKKSIGAIPVGFKPTSGFIDNNRLYIVNMGSATVSIIDLAKNEVIASIETDALPESVVVYKNSLFVTDTDDNYVRVYDLNTKHETKIISGEQPRYMILDKERGALMTANYASDDVSLINANIKVPLGDVDISGKGPVSLALSPLRDYIYVVNEQTNDVSLLPYRFVKKLQYEADKIPVGSRPLRIAFTPDGFYAYVTNFYSDDVSVISAKSRKVIATIDVGSSPYGIVVSSDGRYAYATNFNSNTLSVIDLKAFKSVATIPTGNGPTEVFFR